MSINLSELLTAKVKALGPKEAATYFGVPQPTISLWSRGDVSKQLAAAQKVLEEYEAGLKVTALSAAPTPAPSILEALVPALPAAAPAPAPAPVVAETAPSDKGKVTILMPVYRFVTWQLKATSDRAMAIYGRDQVETAHWPGTCVWKARNILVERFLKSKTEWAIFCDDDVVLPCGNSYIINGLFHARLPEPLASRNAISRLMSHSADKRVVGALCYVKGDPKITGDKMSGRAMCSDAYDSDAMNAELHNPKADWGLRKQEWFVGINFCRIHRSVFEEMAAAAEGRWPDFDLRKDGSPRGWFNPRNNIEGEDLAFAARCKQLGIEMWLDCGLICGHADGQHITWHYNSI